MSGYKGDYNAPAHKSSTVRGSFMSDDSAGVEDGLSARKDFDSESSSDFGINDSVSASGNPRQCISKKKGYGVSSKGHKFDLGC